MNDKRDAPAIIHRHAMALDKGDKAGYGGNIHARKENPMALIHAQPFDVISLKPLAGKLHEVKTHSLLKTGQLQLMRVVMAAGQTMPEHHVAGEITVQCLEGNVLITTPGRACSLAPGELMALPAHEPHGLKALSDSSLLVTVLLKP